jgi:hypothetical protein
MRIYANQNPLNSELTQFIGKDAWVKCIERANGDEDIVFIKIFKYYDRDTYYGNRLSERRVEELNNNFSNGFGITEYNLRRILTRLEHYNLDYLQDCLEVIHPLEVYTTKELVPGYPGGGEGIEKFIGKDFWVKVYDWTSGHLGREIYIKFLRKSGEIINFRSVDADVLEGGLEKGHIDADEFRWLTECMEDEEFDHIDNYSVCEPIEVYTDEEIDEFIEAERARLEEYEEGWPDMLEEVDDEDEFQ